jgi:hypothetical protein
VHALLSLAGHTTKCTTYLIGNFTLAEKIYSTNPSAYAPIQTCVREGPDGRPRFSFDQPSKMVAFLGNDHISKVMREGDFVFGNLVEALGCTVPDVLRK